MSLKRLCCLTVAVIIYTIFMVLLIQGKLRNPMRNYKVFPRKLIVLVSQPRSGSSYLGNLISTTVKSIYFYEPLYQLDKMLKIDLDTAGINQRQSYDTISTEYLRHIFRCDFSDRESWKKVFNSPFKSLSTLSGNECDDADKDENLKYRPDRVEGIRGGNNGRSYMLNRCMPFLNANHLQKECQTMNLMVKLLEFRLPFSNLLNLEEIIDDSIQYKLLYLVRDPRASFYSLLRTGWLVKDFKETKFKDYVAMRCNEMAVNIKQMKQTKHATIVRYEDLIVKPKAALDEFLKFMSSHDAKQLLRELQTTDCYVPRFTNTYNKSSPEFHSRSINGIVNQKESMKEIIAKYDDDTYEDDGENDDNDTDDDDDENTDDDYENKNGEKNSEDDVERSEYDTMEEKHRMNYECYSINKWRYNAEQTFVKIVESKCQDVLSMLGYKGTNGDMDIVHDWEYPLTEPEFKH